ncbi:MAG: N-acetyl-gamma-glutamyl-phosphate reductase [Kofleriaceae bacterium]
MTTPIDVALFGAAGYTGLELAKLCADHPHVRLRCAASDTHAGKHVGQLTGRDHDGLVFVTTAAARTIAASCKVALLAVPPDAARTLAPGLRELKVIDLSHAFRDDPQAIYGLASWSAEAIAGASLVANPGCYATAVITAAAPLVRHGLVEGDLYVAAGSGVTGAGKTADETMSLGEMYGDVRAYKVLRHQHVPEIEAALAKLAVPTRVVLTTHLLPVARGIFATLTARLAQPHDTAVLVERFRDDYAHDPTVTVLPAAEDVTLRKVVGTNQVLLGVASDKRTVVVTAAIDNLLKGAAGQAIENLNLMCGFPRMAGLTQLARHA